MARKPKRPAPQTAPAKARWGRLAVVLVVIAAAAWAVKAARPAKMLSPANPLPAGFRETVANSVKPTGPTMEGMV